MAIEARWWIRNGNSVRCHLCPHSCRIANGYRGLCGARAVERGQLVLPGYGRISAEALDPIEKKPLYHFLPGSMVWSVGFTGCNLNCPFCQNHSIARAAPEKGYMRAPEKLVENAINSGARLIAYTYSEPSIHCEFLLESAHAASAAGLLNVLVTNGNLCKKPAKELFNAMDGVNIDLKSWRAEYYKRILKGNLEAVRQCIEIAIERSWVELTMLIVPGDNDDETDMRNMIQWIASLSESIPLHLSGYYPAYKYKRAPTELTLLHRYKKLAEEMLTYVYLGNTGENNDTVCAGCGKTLIHRRNYSISSNVENGACPDCRTAIPGIFAPREFPASA